IMQVKVSDTLPAVAFDRPNTTSDRLGTLVAAFAHHADGSGVFESSANPIIVGQAAYNSAYGTSFVAAGWCNDPAKPAAKCDGFARMQEQGGQNFKFDTLSGTQLALPFQGKALHDEMNSANFDPYGRMTANLGVEAPNATPANQTVVLFPFVNPATEVLDATGMPSSLNITPIASAADGTQLWKITHNGVDTHPIHFHLFDVQLINRVTWDNIILQPEATELGWKDTVRTSPLEDTIVALRPIVPTLPFAVPDSYRPLNPMMPVGAIGSATSTFGQEAGFANLDVMGNATTTPISNDITDFEWEYMYHCHILGHEEMDMMRPVTVHVARALAAAPALAWTSGGTNFSWTDGTVVDYLDNTTWGKVTNEAGYRVERAEVVGGTPGTWLVVGRVLANRTTFHDGSPLDPARTYAYRVVAWNAAGDSVSNVVMVPGITPTQLAATPLGTNVTVIPLDPATGTAPVRLTFGTVTTPGVTTVTSGLANPATGGFSIGNPATVIDVVTTAAYSGSITICFSYAGVTFGGAGNPAIYHYTAGAWTDVTTSVDAVAQVVCGVATSLSPFTVGLPNTEPGAPTGVTAVAGETSATVSWAAPASDGGSAITGYTVTSDPDAKTCTTTGDLTCVVHDLADGTPYTFTVTATNNVGPSAASDPSSPVTPSPAAPPAGRMGTLPAYLATTSVAVTWSGIAGANPITSYDVRYRRASWNGGFGAWVSWKSATPDTHATLAGAAGSTYCFQAKARDSADHVSAAWSAASCTSVPLDDRSLARSWGWTAGTGSSYFKGTFLASSVMGSELTIAPVQAKRIAIVVTTCPTCGVIRVYWGSTLLRKINLYSATTVRRKVIEVASFTSVRTGTLRIRVTSDDHRVSIDGVAFRRQ
ncbi:MAG: fibronectin type III domain-containing protein, partial [Chloroflexota bacterium]